MNDAWVKRPVSVQSDDELQIEAKHMGDLHGPWISLHQPCVELNESRGVECIRCLLKEGRRVRGGRVEFDTADRGHRPAR